MESLTSSPLSVVPTTFLKSGINTEKQTALQVSQHIQPNPLRFSGQDSFENNSGDKPAYVSTLESLKNPKEGLKQLKTHRQLKRLITQALREGANAENRKVSRFLTAENQLFNPPGEEKNLFHERLPILNKLPVFYSTVDTEIASSETLKKLPDDQKAAASTRLIAKRFIDAETGLSFYGDGKKGNPPLHEQDKPIREIRAQAAANTLDTYNGKYINDLYKNLTTHFRLDSDSLKTTIASSKPEKWPVVVHLVRPGRNLATSDATVNYLSMVAQQDVTDSLNYLAKLNKISDYIRFSDIKQLPVLSRTARSNASPLGRIVQQGYYDTAQIKKNDQVVIVDDHSQAGATVLSMAAAMTSRGANVLAAIMPTVHPFSSQLALSPNVKTLLKKTLADWDPQHQLEQKLKSFGMPLETLTDHEAMIIIAYATSPQNKLAQGQFSQLEEELLKGRKVPEGDSDSLKPVLEQKPGPVQEIINEMDAEIKRSRTVTQPLAIKSVHVMDWDDFLRDEKGLNYQLMHNAIFVSAQRYGEKYPFLKQLANALADKRESDSTDTTNKRQPLLSMSQQQFADTTIRNTQFLKRDAIDNLLTHLDDLQPGLQTKFDGICTCDANTSSMTGDDHKHPINNIIWHEFRRQYQVAIRPDKKRVDIPSQSMPFQNAGPTLMPGAEKLLERKRRPDNFIALISNRYHGDLEKEINKMGLAHYFDSVQGTPQKRTIVDGELTLNHSKYKKPDSHRLQKLLTRHPELEQAQKWHFWGDTGKDINQVIPLLTKDKLLQKDIRSTLVNPELNIQNSIDDDLKTGEKKISFRTADSLETLKSFRILRSIPLENS